MIHSTTSVCVFCGSSPGSEIYRESASAFGQALAKRGLRLIFGGGKIGLMGILADAALRQGGEVLGVIPQFLIDFEVAHDGLSELIVVNSMHERKSTMADHADAFVAMPGGFGTLEEFFEVLTWLQLGLHNKPCILLNVNGFFTPLLTFLRSSQEAGFVSDASMALITVVNTIDELMTFLSLGSSDNRFAESLT